MRAAGDIPAVKCPGKAGQSLTGRGKSQQETSAWKTQIRPKRFAAIRAISSQPVEAG